MTRLPFCGLLGIVAALIVAAIVPGLDNLMLAGIGAVLGLLAYVMSE